ncbi:hypothetical protein TSUD_155370 [Trifolium subterraneum]|uniref:Uncharacterized protein n=1 Tax=Trifolium subterraneum TaxID=3900 RepID=A0A2Z6MTR2_TRISU|nr:hypothetical protein TSUD_155370 [Trifolium subterraneum]
MRERDRDRERDSKSRSRDRFEIVKGCDGGDIEIDATGGEFEGNDDILDEDGGDGVDDF